MKKVLFCFVALFLSLAVVGQDDKSPYGSKNEVSFVVSDLLNGAFQFKYEREIKNQMSLGIGIGYKGKEGLIKLSGLDTEHVKTSDLTYSGLKIIPEFRYYIKKSMLGGMDGFYIGAYGKHTSFKSDLDGTYIDDANQNFDIEFDANLNITSVGIMAGYKYRLSDKFVIDFLIAGPGLGFHSYSLDQQQSLPDEFYDDLNEALQNYSLFDLIDGGQFEFKTNDRKSNFSRIAFRYAISVGYSF